MIQGSKRALAWAAVPVAAVLVLSGCSSSSSSSSKHSPTPTAPSSAPVSPGATGGAAGGATGGSSGAPAPANTATFTPDQAAVADAYTKFFSASTPIDQRMMLVQDSQVLGPALQSLTSNPAVATASATVTDVKVSGDTAAVTFSIMSNGTPILPDQHGNAVKQNGTWKVGGMTVCKLVSLVGQAPSACASYTS